MTKQLVSLKELSQILNKSENSIRYHVRMGRIRPEFRYGKVYVFDPDAVIAQLKRETTR